MRTADASLLENDLLEQFDESKFHTRELLKFAPATAAAAFRNMGVDGSGCTWDLTAESVSVVLGQLSGDHVDADNQWMASPSNVKCSGILHKRLIRTAGSSYIYLQLNINNCQLPRRGHYVQ